MGSYLVGYHTCANVFLLWQGKVLLRSNIAEHGCTIPAYHRSTYGRGDVVIGGSYIGYKRAQCIERCSVTFLYLSLHVLLDLVHRHMTRPLDKRLYILCPGTLHQFAHRVEFGKLGCIIGIVG